MSSSKEHKPTRRRLEQAHREGKTVKSQLLTRLVGPLIGCNIFVTVVRSPWIAPPQLIEYLYSRGFSDPVSCLVLTGVLLVGSVFCLLLPSAILGLSSEVLQSGCRFSVEQIIPRGDRVTPSFGRLSKGFQGVWILALKASLLLVVLFRFFNSQLALFAGDGRPVSVEVISRVAFGISSLLEAALLLALVGAIEEYLRQRRQFLQSASMTHDELRREFRETEGDPHVKAMRKGMHQSLLTQDLVRAVRRSKVIVVERT